MINLYPKDPVPPVTSIDALLNIIALLYKNHVSLKKLILHNFIYTDVEILSYFCDVFSDLSIIHFAKKNELVNAGDIEFRICVLFFVVSII